MRKQLRSAYHLLGGVLGFGYDIARFVRYSSWHHSMADEKVRSFYSVIVYHALEKSLSYKRRRKGAGWNNALLLRDLLRAAQSSGNIGFHDRAGKTVLQKFLSLPETDTDDKKSSMEASLERITFAGSDGHGARTYSARDFARGKLNDPENFFFSRYSLREFNGEIVGSEIITRAVSLALKTPSVCNRQPWKVYHTSDTDVKRTFLSYQSGNQPFGTNIPNLIVIATDLKAFFGSQEHYQHWIEGGLFSMSLMYAFHSLGVATCPLNWSQLPSRDRSVRKLLNIEPNHTIIMAMAVGFPDIHNKVCVSARVPVDSLIQELAMK